MTVILDRSATVAEGQPRLRVRGPAYGVITECLRIQASARPRSRVARLFGASPLQPDARSWYRESIAEIYVAKTLKNLGSSFTLLHTGAGSFADHMVVGPTGVFTVSTKNHSAQRVRVTGEQLFVNGRRTNHIRDARHAASSAARILSSGVGGAVDVTPIIAIVDPGSLKVGALRNPLVVRSSRLGRTITDSPTRMSDATIIAILMEAGLSGIWHTDAQVHDDTLRHEARFALLKFDVERAARRRWMWVAGGLGVALAALAALTLML